MFRFDDLDIVKIKPPTMTTTAVGDSYALAIEKPGAIFTGTKEQLTILCTEMRQLGLLSFSTFPGAE